jgi:ABC-type nitrate/sulfonate/bicarbonate transport system substrate-binding protein
VNNVRNVLLTLGLTSALALTACGSSGSASSAGEASSAENGLRTVTLAHDGTAAAAAISLGMEQGFFEDEGLAVEHKGLGTPPAIIAAVQSNQVTAGSVPTIPLINAVDQGIPLTAFAPDSGYPADTADMTEFDTIGIYVDPAAGIERPRDLEGKKVAVPSRKAVFEVLVADAVRNDGGDPAKVEWVVLDFGSQVTALSDGKVAAAGLPMPFTVQAADSGSELLVQPGADFYEQGPTNVWVAGPEASKDKELIMDLQRAIEKSHEYANAHREETMARAAEITGIEMETITASPGFNYFPPVLNANDIGRTHDKLLDLGYLPREVDLTGNVMGAEQ